jgi:hypothetical protein
MLELRVYNDDVVENGMEVPVYELNSIYRVNIIGGNSGTGKTLFSNNLKLANNNIEGWRCECNKEIVFLDPSNLKRYDNDVDILFIWDEVISQKFFKEKVIKFIQKSKNYFIILDRSLEASIDNNIKALYIVKKLDKKVYNTVVRYSIEPAIKMQKSSDIDIQRLKSLVVEDSASGRTFWQNVFKGLTLIGEESGNSLIEKNILDAMKYEGNVLVALDYDQGLLPMLKIMQNIDIDKSRILFINMESFEEIICNSEFILSKYPEMRDKVINYEKYIDATYQSTGKYFSNLLFEYVKVKSPLKNEGQRNATKFYEKGMKNFKECFIDDCCQYDEVCKLYLDGNKIENMLNNKFKDLQKLV